MKILKTITTVVVLLFTIAGTQTTQAQTKEETIFWLKKYGQKMMMEAPKYKYGVKGNEMYFEYNDESTGYYHYGALKFDDLKFAYTDKIDFSDEGDYIILRFNKTLLLFADEYVDSTLIELKKDISKDDTERLKKALIHLAELYGAKPAPKVDKNTF